MLLEQYHIKHNNKKIFDVIQARGGGEHGGMDGPKCGDEREAGLKYEFVDVAGFPPRG
jgi:hypothetical protein